MKFFIDTANLDQIKEAHALGILDGVTTNPSLMAKEGKELAGLHPNIVVKVPMIKEGVKAIRGFTDNGIPLLRNHLIH